MGFGEGVDGVVEEAGEGEFGGADEGGVVAEGRDVEAGLAGDDQDVGGDPVAYLGLGAGVDLAQHSAEDDQAGVEEVDQVGDADAEPVADAVEGGAGLSGS